MTNPRVSEVRMGARPRRVIALDWHGGPIAGLAEYGSSTSSAVYQFSLVGGVTGDSRTFLLKVAPEGAWGTLLELLEEVSPPRWPVWVASWKAGSTEWRGRVEALLGTIEKADQPIVALVEAESIEEVAVAVRLIANETERDSVEKMLAETADHDVWSAFCHQG